MNWQPWLLRYLSSQVGASYAQAVWQDVQQILRLYDVYDGRGQLWQTASKLDYKPTKRITNHIRHLIMEEARFMFSRAPEITIIPTEEGEANKSLCEELESHLREVLEQSGWQRKLTTAGRDCFIGKRVAMKVSGGRGRLPVVQFRPSLEFVHDVEFDDQERLVKIVFAYAQNNEQDTARQRFWVQTYWLENGACLMNEAIFNGDGHEVEAIATAERIGLPYIPVHVIVNDGLTGDCLGESDVEALEPLQDAYNRMTSDDQDALKFNMFPQRIFTDASEESLERIRIAPGSMVDLQTDPAAADRQAKFGILESGFNYDSRFENAIERVKTDMYELLSVPNATTEDYKGLGGVSGKAMRALYWPLITRCEEKWATWDVALKWMVRCIVDVESAYGMGRFDKARYLINIEHLYPITDDEEDERQLDLSEVARQARSRRAYIEKWQPNVDADAELKQIKGEQALLEDAYAGAIGVETARLPDGLSHEPRV